MLEPNQTIDYDSDELSIGDRFPELSLGMSNEKILKLTKKWKISGEKAKKDYDDVGEENVEYWQGDFYKRSDLVVEDDEMRIKDNRIFSSIETFLPILTRESPDPIIQTIRDPYAEELGNKVRNKLIEKIDTLRLKLKIKKAARYWSFYQLGVMKVFWNSAENDIGLRVIKPKNLIFQDKASIDEGVYNGEFIGEYITKPAKDVKEMFPKSKKIIDEYTKGDDGTVIRFIEWHTNEFTVWEFNNNILDKIKNKDWNYDSEQESVDEFGNPVVNDKKGFNHFTIPQMPYAFFSVYNLGENVYDETGLIQQAKFAQDTINDRMRQINKNVQNQNNSVVFYGIDETKARFALKQLKDGGAVTFTNKQEEGFDRVGGTPLTSDVYNELNNLRQTIDSVMATGPITRGEDSRDRTVRGKILSKQADVDRISFIAAYLEQFVDRILNLMVQMMYVYYEEPVSILNYGTSDSQNPVLIKTDFESLVGKLLVSVKDGSLIPKDPLMEANQAVDLYEAGALDILTLFEKLDIENAKEIATRAMLFRGDPQLYLSEVLGFSPSTPPQNNQIPVEGQGGQPVPQIPEGEIPQNIAPEQQNILSQVPIQ